MTNAPDLRAPFAQRLHELCTDKGLAKRGRQTELGRLFGVSQQAAKKWLDGLSYPTTETVVAIANWGDVNVTWLLQGAGPKHGNRVDAKVLVLDEAIRSLPTDLGVDLIDNIRAKLSRQGGLIAKEPTARWIVALDAYERDFKKRPH